MRRTDSRGYFELNNSRSLTDHSDRAPTIFSGRLHSKTPGTAFASLERNFVRVSKGLPDMRVTLLVYVEHEGDKDYDKSIHQIGDALTSAGHHVSVLTVHNDVQKLIAG